MSKRRMIILVIVAMTFMYMIVGIVSFISIRSGVVKTMPCIVIRFITI